MAAEVTARARPPWRGLASALRTVVFGLAGSCLALILAGDVSARIGPFDTTVSARPALSGRTEVRLAPLGSITLDTHGSPLALQVRVDELRLEEAERIAADPAVLESLEDDIAGDARRALTALAVRGAVVAIVGGAAATFLASRSLRGALAGALVGTVGAASIGAVTMASFDARAVAEPSYSGLLTVAPAAVGDIEDVVDRFGEYRAQLSDLVGNVVLLYQAAQSLPTFAPSGNTARVLHVSDIHLNPQAFDLIDLLVDRFDIDAVADTGDLTDWGSEPETQLVERIGRLGVPYVWVRGNHDSAVTQQAVAGQPNAVVLDGDPASVAGLRFWGVPDTRFTPNKDQPIGREVERDAAEAAAPTIARMLDEDQPPEVDIVMVHDPRMAGRLDGRAPLVLAGHTHNAAERSLGTTRLMIEGSTGGGGLRALRGETPEPLTCTILYFDLRSRRLVAYDRVSVRGLGETGVRIERRVIDPG